MSTTTIRVDMASATQHKENITERVAGLSAVTVPRVRLGVSQTLSVTQLRLYGAAIAFKVSRYTERGELSAAHIMEVADRKKRLDQLMSRQFGLLKRTWLPESNLLSGRNSLDFEPPEPHWFNFGL